MQSLFLLYDPYGNTRGLKTVHWTVFAGCGPPALFDSVRLA